MVSKIKGSVVFVLRGEFPIMSWPEEEMPVIGHQAVGGDAKLGPGLGFGENILMGGVVSGLLKDRQPAHATVQDVIGESPTARRWRRGMTEFYRKRCEAVKKRLPTPFLVSPTLRRRGRPAKLPEK